MIAFLWGTLGLIGAVLLAAIGELVSDEIRYWLDLIPRAILHLAATQLDPAQRETIYQDEWIPELTYALRGKESRPITRLITGTSLATGILISARHIARDVHRASPAASAGAVASSGAASSEPFHLMLANTTRRTMVLEDESFAPKSITVPAGASFIIEGANDRLARKAAQQGFSVISRKPCEPRTSRGGGRSAIAP